MNGDQRQDWRTLHRTLAARAMTASRERRARVLAHPGLAAQLTHPPLSYSEPQQWTGYVPPRMWREEVNDSPRRAALVAISAEALDRENRSAT